MLQIFLRRIKVITKAPIKLNSKAVRHLHSTCIQQKKKTLKQNVFISRSIFGFDPTQVMGSRSKEYSENKVLGYSQMSLKNLKNILKLSLESVKPDKLVTKALNRNGDSLHINGRTYKLENNVKVIGFGKAVHGMAVGVLNVIDDHVSSGLLSVPYGSSELNQTLPTKIQVMEGAKNNLPDEHSLYNAEEIERFIRKDVSHLDILIVLISGGGSALLPSPVKAITLDEKLETIKLISRNGGDIHQLNTMRKHLSSLKGGKLGALTLTKNVVSLIISDIVGDPLDLIASGPTVYDESTTTDCLNILKDLNILEKIPESVYSYLQAPKTSCIPPQDRLEHCNNALVGNNDILLRHTSNVVFNYGFKPFILSSRVEGDAQFIGEIMADFVVKVAKEDFKDGLETLSKALKIHEVKVTMKDLKETSKMCFIFGGETTVRVEGTGKGGRNQHMVLSALSHFKKAVLRNPNILKGITFLSAGTDGQDGPTDATGAFLDNELLKNCMDQDFDAFIQNCGSYDFFSSSKFTSKYLLKTGLTGINVMDVQLLFVDRSCV